MPKKGFAFTQKTSTVARFSNNVEGVGIYLITSFPSSKTTFPVLKTWSPAFVLHKPLSQIWKARLKCRLVIESLNSLKKIQLLADSTLQAVQDVPDWLQLKGIFSTFLLFFFSFLAFLLEKANFSFPAAVQAVPACSWKANFSTSNSKSFESHPFKNIAPV